jgi:spore germination cell wall hydrolase CwlJ-like protein
MPCVSPTLPPMSQSVRALCIFCLATFAVNSSHAQPNPQAQRCMALAMYWEARGEGEKGMYAVGSVVMNRVRDKRFPGSVCAVVKQGGETAPCQFSWWCDGKSDRPTDKTSWVRALHLADQILHRRRADPTRGALYFHSTSVRPGWRLKRAARVGNHIFYR